MSARACDGRPCDVLRLRDLRTGSPLAVMMASLASLLLETYPGTSVIPTPLAPGRWIDDQSRNLRSQVHKVTRRLEELGTVRVLESTAAAAVAAAFVRFVDLEAGGYKVDFRWSSTDSNMPMNLGIPAITIGRNAPDKAGRSHSLDEWMDVEKEPMVKAIATSLSIILATAGLE
jgi:hypothetical protein